MFTISTLNKTIPTLTLPNDIFVTNLVPLLTKFKIPAILFSPSLSLNLSSYDARKTSVCNPKISKLCRHKRIKLEQI